jgi:Na+/H+-translocating membrane pyrophosphatase
MVACSPKSSAAYRRYMRRFWPATVLYVAAIGLATWLIPDNAHASPLTVAIALLPGVGMVAMIWAIGRLLVELDDEFLKMLEIRKALAATGVVLVVASVWGILELYTDVPRLPVFLIFPLWCGGLAVGQLWNKVAGL